MLYEQGATMQPNSIWARLNTVSWPFVFFISLIAFIGLACLFSAGGGNLSPYADKHGLRFFILLVAAIGVALVPIRFWFRMAYPAYAFSILLLIYVLFKGESGGGAQRWIDLGFMNLQPSELVKVAVIIALARYFHSVELSSMGHPLTLALPAAFIVFPVALVMMQPDLGTGLIILMNGAAVVFVAGIPFWIYIVLFGIGLALAPVAWFYILHDYQKARILTFLNPENDPFGSGYHIAQSKIAIGSGGMTGKGFLNGSQSHLNFLPEKQTDFIFTLWVEETGLAGGVILLFINAIIILYGTWIAFRCRHTFGKLLAYGIIFNYALYVLINIAMVMGMIPVVGVPLPLVSYGGTAMLAVLAGFGLILCCHANYDARLPRMK